MKQKRVGETERKKKGEQSDGRWTGQVETGRSKAKRSKKKGDGPNEHHNVKRNRIKQKITSEKRRKRLRVTMVGGGGRSGQSGSHS